MGGVTSRVGAQRKSATERRAEIVSAAELMALDEGLESLTLRRVADALGVVPGLVNHYFPAIDELVATAFGTAAAAELEEILAAVAAVGGPTERIRRLLALLTDDDRDRLSLLWLDAWQAGRRRPALHAEVVRLMVAWQERVAELISDGVRAGEFHTDDPATAAARILTVVDGLSVQAVMRSAIDDHRVRELLFTTAERELSLPPATLTPTHPPP
jgi:AcrR family transcriptional regulator